MSNKNLDSKNRNQKNRHLDDRLVAFVDDDDVCKSRDYHIIEDINQFRVIPDSEKESEEHAKMWSVSKTLECNCSQSEHVARCVHEDAVSHAIGQDEHETTDYTIAIAEGRTKHGLTWYKLLDEEVNRVSYADDEILVAINHIGDELILYQDTFLRYQDKDATNGINRRLEKIETDSDVITAFTDGSETRVREEVMNHVEHISGESKE